VRRTQSYHMQPYRQTLQLPADVTSILSRKASALRQPGQTLGGFFLVRSPPDCTTARVRNTPLGAVPQISWAWASGSHQARFGRPSAAGAGSPLPSQDASEHCDFFDIYS
jgi:hypothetical protein